MKRTLNLVLGLLLVTTLGLVAPAAADDDPPDLEDVCVKFSLNPPGASVDPWCVIPPPWPPEP